MGTVPLYWGEARDLAELIGGDSRPHWAREVLERRFSLTPLDFLDEGALAGQSRLLLAQPRGLAAQENVALDAWVRRGGRLLLFADPMMTGDSRHGIGDRRRPQDVILLSPILRHWGLQLAFDPDQPAGLRWGEIAGRRLPVNLAGHISLAELGAGEREAAALCAPNEGGLWVRCRLGEGHIVVIADAALLDHAGPWPGAREGLDALAALAFGESGEFAGADLSAAIGTASNGENQPVCEPGWPKEGGSDMP